MFDVIVDLRKAIVFELEHAQGHCHLGLALGMNGFLFGVQGTTSSDVSFGPSLIGVEEVGI